jgi:hypothetical protein
MVRGPEEAASAEDDGRCDVTGFRGLYGSGAVAANDKRGCVTEENQSGTDKYHRIQTFHENLQCFLVE